MENITQIATALVSQLGFMMVGSTTPPQYHKFLKRLENEEIKVTIDYGDEHWEVTSLDPAGVCNWTLALPFCAPAPVVIGAISGAVTGK